jgi:hypothetical protein
MVVRGQFHVPGHFSLWGRAPVTHWIGGWVGPRAGLEAVAKEEKSLLCPYGEWNPGRPARNLVTILTELSRLSTQYYKENFNILNFLGSCNKNKLHSKCGHRTSNGSGKIKMLAGVTAIMGP